MTYPVSLYPPNSEAVRHTLRSRSCVLTRRNADNAAFMRMDVIQTGLLVQDAFSPSNIRLMKKLLETPTR